jgi:hypothetical protein
MSEITPEQALSTLAALADEATLAAYGPGTQHVLGATIAACHAALAAAIAPPPESVAAGTSPPQRKGKAPHA